jgi:hypothetical protein
MSSVAKSQRTLKLVSLTKNMWKPLKPNLVVFAAIVEEFWNTTGQLLSI